MATAFQPNAFQNNAFQIDDEVVVVTPPAPDAGGAGGLGVRRPRYTGRLWRQIKAARRRARECALAEEREALERAAAAAERALRAEELSELRASLLADALIDACRAQTVAEIVRIADAIIQDLADEQEDEEALIMMLLD